MNVVFSVQILLWVYFVDSESFNVVLMRFDYGFLFSGMKGSFRV